MTPRTYGDIEGFVLMLMAACEDTGMNETLEKLLSAPDDRRKEIVRMFLWRFRETRAPQSLVEAFVCLLDDDVAEREDENFRQLRKGARHAVRLPVDLWKLGSATI